MQTPLQAMYEAAVKKIPAHGDRVTGVANTLAGAINILNVQAAYAGDPPCMTSLLHVAGDVDNVLRVAVTSLDSCSAALIATAKHYRDTDEQAAADFAGISDSIKNAPLPHHTTTSVGDPEKPGFEATSNLPPGFPGSGQTVHVDPSPDPTSAEQEQQHRDDHEPTAPSAPVPDPIS